MRTVAVLIGTLDAIPCDIRASVNALDTSQWSYGGHW